MYRFFVFEGEVLFRRVRLVWFGCSTQGIDEDGSERKMSHESCFVASKSFDLRMKIATARNKQASCTDSILVLQESVQQQRTLRKVLCHIRVVRPPHIVTTRQACILYEYY